MLLFEKLLVSIPEIFTVFNHSWLQIINSFATGVVFATVYLYTILFLVKMGYHAVYDILFLTTVSTVMTGPNALNWQYLILTTSIYLILPFSYYQVSEKVLSHIICSNGD